uniref:PDZ domain-containing protein n=1 Tax=Panagrolaimus sp. PS1159 TaxID=55785 RepID=A0AC35G382_9BILA
MLIESPNKRRDDSPTHSDDSGFHGAIGDGYVSVFAAAAEPQQQHSRTGSIFDEMDRRIAKSRTFGLLSPLKLDSSTMNSEIQSNPSPRPISRASQQPSLISQIESEMEIKRANAAAKASITAISKPQISVNNNIEAVKYSSQSPPPLPSQPPINPFEDEEKPKQIVTTAAINHFNKNENPPAVMIPRRSTNPFEDDEKDSSESEIEKKPQEEQIAEMHFGGDSSPIPPSIYEPMSSEMEPLNQSTLRSFITSKTSNSSSSFNGLRKTSGNGNGLRTGWQEIKEKNRERSSSPPKSPPTLSPMPRSPKTTPRTIGVSNLVKQFASLQNGEIPAPSIPAPPSPRSPGIRGPYAQQISTTFEERRRANGNRSPKSPRVIVSSETLRYSPSSNSASPKPLDSRRTSENNTFQYTSNSSSIPPPPLSPRRERSPLRSFEDSKKQTEGICLESRNVTIVRQTLNENISPPKTVVGNLDFSKYADIKPIGRPMDSTTDESEDEIKPKHLSQKEEEESEIEVSEEQIAEIKRTLKNDFDKYNIFTVILQKDKGFDESSVGLILTAAITQSESYITIQRVIIGSIADKSDKLQKGDRIFFVQGQSTSHLTASEAREIIKRPASKVHLIVGRYSKAIIIGSDSIAAREAVPTFTDDPATLQYSTDPIKVVLRKSDLGCGIAMDGGFASRYGNRPIVVKKIFSVGEAARDGRLKLGDQISAINGISMEGKTQLDAWKILKSCPEGTVEFVIYKRIE